MIIILFKNNHRDSNLSHEASTDSVLRLRGSGMPELCCIIICDVFVCLSVLLHPERSYDSASMQTWNSGSSNDVRTALQIESPLSQTY